ncbi:MAG: hypothetical protein P1S60_02075 [Anaerolineae bacterium]|nr:hypothetical protein [Anaerolineae bacterium]
MSLLGNPQNFESPIQEHHVKIANDIQWISGTIKTLGDAHNYINQDDLTYWNIVDAHISPWSFTGLPNSHVSSIMVDRDNIQLMMLTDTEALEAYRKPLRTSVVILNLPLLIICGEAPFLGEAKIENFFDYWKGTFLPLSSAKIHYLTETTTRLPSTVDLLFVNRHKIVSYISG